MFVVCESAKNQVTQQKSAKVADVICEQPLYHIYHIFHLVYYILCIRYHMIYIEYPFMIEEVYVCVFGLSIEKFSGPLWGS